MTPWQNKQHIRQTIKEQTEWQTIPDSPKSKHTPPHPDKCLEKLLERSSCNSLENGTPRRHPSESKVNHDPRPDDRGHEM